MLLRPFPNAAAKAEPAVKRAKSQPRPKKKSDTRRCGTRKPFTVGRRHESQGRQSQRQQERSPGIAHVLSTFNNTIVTITDMNGNVIGWSSAGKVGFKRLGKSTAYAAQMVGDAPAGKWVTG